jgi:hypothetical protein
VLSWTSVQELLDRRLDSDVRAGVERVIRATPDVTTYTRLRARRMGPVVLVDVELGLRPSFTLSAAHHIADDVRARVLAAIPAVADVLVHTFPDEGAASVFCADEACPGAAVGGFAKAGADAAAHGHAHREGEGGEGEGEEGVTEGQSLRSHHEPRVDTSSSSSATRAAEAAGGHGHSHGEPAAAAFAAAASASSSSSSAAGAAAAAAAPAGGPGGPAATLSPTALEAAIRKAVAAVPEVAGLTHLRLHYAAAQTAPGMQAAGVRVEMEVVVAPLEMTLREAVGVVRKVRAAVEALPAVAVADVHLEVDPN